MSRVVAAVDGPASRAGLRWAAGEARARQWPLVVVTAWTFPALSILPVAPAPPTSRHLAHQAAETIGEAVAALGEDLAGVRLERLVVEGNPADAILDQVGPSDLLVVGARGLHGVGSLLLGSVSRHCAEHAPCPVVIVHAGSRAA